MSHVVVTGHGTFAGGLLDAVEMVMGTREGVSAVNFPASDTALELRENLTDAFAAVAPDEHLVVLCDLKGGSPFNVSVSLAADRPNTTVVYGANLPLLLDFLGRKRAGNVPDVLASSVTMARKSLNAVTALPSVVTAATDETSDDDWD